MNEYPTHKQRNIINVFAICCIIIVGYIMTIPSQYQVTTKPNTSKLQIGITVGENKTGEQNTGSERSITKSTSTVKQGTVKNTKKNDYPKQKPLGTNRQLEVVVYVKGFPEDSQATKIATYAYKISNGDIDFLATLKAENGGFNMYQQSNVYKNGKREESYGLCQLMKKYHPEVNTKIFRESREYQVETCYKKYVGGTKFYGFNVRGKYKNDFIIK